MFMHVELKNIRIIELELFERTRCAIRRRLRRDELRYDRSKRVANRVGAEGDGHGATRRRARARARHRPSPPNPSRPRSNGVVARPRAAEAPRIRRNPNPNPRILVDPALTRRNREQQRRQAASAGARELVGQWEIAGKSRLRLCFLAWRWRREMRRCRGREKEAARHRCELSAVVGRRTRRSGEHLREESSNLRRVDSCKPRIAR